MTRSVKQEVTSLLFVLEGGSSCVNPEAAGYRPPHAHRPPGEIAQPNSCQDLTFVCTHCIDWNGALSPKDLSSSSPQTCECRLSGQRAFEDGRRTLGGHLRVEAPPGRAQNQRRTEFPGTGGKAILFPVCPTGPWKANPPATH